jgi:murein DD-endopeptidase MepM/ murein hydrolase activator NlpD
MHVTARAMQPGELVVVTIAGVPTAAIPHVRAFDADVPVARTGPGTWRALIGIDLDCTPGPYVISVDPSPASAPLARTITVRPKTFRTRRLRVDDAYVNPPADLVERIQTEAARLNKLWLSSAAEPLWSDGFVRPVPQPANSAFGSRSIFNGTPRAPHSGADFPSPAGTPVRAPAGGRVVLAAPLYYTGNTVVIDHGQSLFSLFAHFSRIDVQEGDRVTAGQVIGRVGATGRVTGPHLHWTVRLGGARVDPLALIALLQPVPATGLERTAPPAAATGAAPR